MIFRILGTIFIGLSCLTCLFKNNFIFGQSKHPYLGPIVWSVYGLLWRAFIITALWII